MVTISEGGLYMRKGRRGAREGRKDTDILEPETDGATVSSLGSRFERFVDLSADTASVPSRAPLSYRSKKPARGFPIRSVRVEVVRRDREPKRDGEKERRL